MKNKIQQNNIVGHRSLDDKELRVLANRFYGEWLSEEHPDFSKWVKGVNMFLEYLSEQTEIKKEEK